MPFLFENLDVYKKAIEALKTVNIYCAKLRDKDLKNQLWRAIMSVPINIAEGQGRSTARERLQFYKIARGSLFESASLLQICRELLYIDENDYSQLYDRIEEVGKMLNGLIHSLK